MIYFSKKDFNWDQHKIRESGRIILYYRLEKLKIKKIAIIADVL